MCSLNLMLSVFKTSNLLKLKFIDLPFTLLYDSEQKLPNKKEHPITLFCIKLPDVFIKNMIRKLKREFISISTVDITIHLVEFELKLSKFSTFWKKTYKKTFFKVIETSFGIKAKLVNFKLKFSSKAIFIDRFFICKTYIRKQVEILRET